MPAIRTKLQGRGSKSRRWNVDWRNCRAALGAVAQEWRGEAVAGGFATLRLFAMLGSALPA